MLSYTLSICLSISLAVFFFVVIVPLFLQKPERYFTRSSQYDFDDSLSILEIVAELEADYRSGKLTKEDFEALSMDFKREYMELRGKKRTDFNRRKPR